MIEIREAIEKKGIKDFVCFPFSLYKDNPYWVPPIIKDEMEVFDPSINPVFKTAQARFFLAYMNGEIVGIFETSGYRSHRGMGDEDRNLGIWICPVLQEPTHDLNTIERIAR